MLQLCKNLNPSQLKRALWASDHANKNIFRRINFEGDCSKLTLSVAIVSIKPKCMDEGVCLIQ